MPALFRAWLTQQRHSREQTEDLARLLSIVTSQVISCNGMMKEPIGPDQIMPWAWGKEDGTDEELDPENLPDNYDPIAFVQ